MEKRIIAIIAALLAGGFIGFLLHIILFYIIDNWDTVHVDKRVYKMIGYFSGLGGGSGIGSYFISRGMFPYFVIGLVAMFLFWSIPVYRELLRERREARQKKTEETN